jgi:hypothetical protein
MDNEGRARGAFSVKGVFIRAIVALALGLLGPHPSIHVGFRQPIGASLFRLREIYNQLSRSPLGGEQIARETVRIFIESYASYCITVFVILTCISWAFGRRES